ncbi:MAG: flagellar motor switch protein FliM [Candidatus Cloacimonetes bacterium]|nr:flagellar motor switch protein FliM [Candidatus Cloacimonadota bacterium]
MSKLLSQAEIDALLEGEKNIDTSIFEIQKSKEARIYDFRHPDRVSKEQLKILRNIHDNFSRLISTYLSNQLRTMIDVKVPNIDQVTYFEFTMSAASFTYMYVFSIDKLDGFAILETDPRFSFFIIDRLFGGTGNVINKSEQSPTIIERSVMNNVAERILEYLKEAWQHIEVLEARIANFETNPQLVTVAPASETMIVLTFPVTARNFEFNIILCFPYFMLEPVLKKINSQNYMALLKKAPSEEDQQNLYRAVEHTEVRFTVDLGKSYISVKDFLELKENELLLLETKITDPLIARVQEHKKFVVSPGKKGKKKAVRIDNIIDEEGDII